MIADDVGSADESPEDTADCLLPRAYRNSVNDGSYDRDLTMSAAMPEKQKLNARLNRIRGQIDSIERELAIDLGGKGAMQQIAGIRGALGSLLSEVIKIHIRDRLENMRPEQHAMIMQELTKTVTTYIK